jgi:hypothetical protein
MKSNYMENEKQETIFVQGMFWRPRPETAPEFVRGKIALNVRDMKQFFIDNAQHISGKGFINVDLMKSQKGTYYFKLDTWKPKNTDTVAEIKQDIRETLNPNITAEEAKILAEHRAKHNKKVEPEYSDDEINPHDIPFN